MDRSSRPSSWGRAGTHRVPADLLVGAPDPRPVPARLGRPVHRVARVLGRAPPRDAGWPCWSTSGTTGCGSSRPVSPPSVTARSRTTPTGGSPWLIAVATIPALIAALLFNDVIEARGPRTRLVALVLVVGGVILWLADRWGRGRRGSAASPPGRRRDRRRPGPRPHPGRVAVRHLDVGRALRRPRPRGRGPVRRSSWRRRSPRWRSPTSGSSSSGARSSARAAADAGRGRRRLVRLGHPRDRRPAALPADELVQVVFVYRFGARGGRAPRIPGQVRRSAGAPMEVMKQLRQRAIRDLVEQRRSGPSRSWPPPPRARLPTTQATISRDVAELGLIKAGRSGCRPTRSRRASRGRHERRGPDPDAPRDMPVEIRDAGRCSSCARAWLRACHRGGARPRAGRRSSARSPATTSSPPALTGEFAARCTGSPNWQASAPDTMHNPWPPNADLGDI